MQAEALIQSHFIDVISLTLGDPPKDRDWAISLAERVTGKHLVADALEREAKRLVESGSKAFPGFSRCVSAISAAVSAPEANAHHGASESLAGLTPAQRYHVMAAKHVAQTGKACFQITNITQPQWDCWEAYYIAIGVPFMVARMSAGNPITTPAEFPWQFDGAANETVLRNAARDTADRRARVSNFAVVPRVLLDWRSMAGVRPKPKAEPAKPEKWEPNLSPVSVSSSLLATLGGNHG